MTDAKACDNGGRACQEPAPVDSRLLRMLVEDSPLGLYVYHLEDLDDDRTLRMVAVNRAAEIAVGIKREALVGHTLDECFPGLRAQGVPQTYARVVRTGIPVDLGEIPYGDERLAQAWYRVTASPLPDQHLAVRFENITSRHELETRLDEGRQWLTALLHHTQAGIQVVDTQRHRVVHVNPAAQAIMGRPEAAILNKPCRECLCPGEPDGCLAEGDPSRPVRRECVVRCPDGSTKPVLVSVVPFVLSDRHYVIETLTDISELRRSEAAQHEAESRYRLLFEETSEGVFETALDGTLLDVNDAFARIFGFASREGMIGTNAAALYVDPSDRIKYRRRMEQHEAVHQYPIRMWHRDGTQRHCRISANVVRDAAGRVVAYRGILHDVTEEKNAQSQLRRAHADIERLLSSMSSILVSASSDGVVQQWNAAATRVLGLAAQEAVGRPISECLPLVEMENVIEALRTCRDERRQVALDQVRFRRPDGAEGILGLTLTPMLDDKGRFDGVLALGADVTERKRLETQLSQAQKLEAIGRLSAGIAHEINTPLQYVGDNARFLQESIEDVVDFLSVAKSLTQKAEGSETAARLAETAERIDLEYLLKEMPLAISQSIEGVDRVSQIVRAMREFSHVGRDTPQTVDINEALRSTLTVARNEWKYTSDVIHDLADDLPPVLCRAGEINQALLNIVINAAHAVREAVEARGDGVKGSIRVQTRRLPEGSEAGTGVVIRITDSGVGIPPGIRERIFEPFFTTKAVGEGTGQGLTIAHDIIARRCGGAIRFDSKVGVGTTFEITLPSQPPADPKTSRGQVAPAGIGRQAAAAERPS